MFTKRNIKGALQALVDHDPRTRPDAHGRRMCHYCETPDGQEHDSGCSWTVGLLMVTEKPALAGAIRVGEDPEECLARMTIEEGDEPDDEPADMEELEAAAAAAIRALDVSAAKRQVMAELRARPLEAEPFDAGERMAQLIGDDEEPLGTIWESED